MARGRATSNVGLTPMQSHATESLGKLTGLALYMSEFASSNLVNAHHITSKGNTSPHC